MTKIHINISLVLISLILMANCKDEKIKIQNNKMTAQTIDICSTKPENLNLDIIYSNIHTIAGEDCLDKVLDYIKNNLNSSSDKSLKIIDKLIENHEYEYLMDYSNELFLLNPKMFLDYFNYKKDSEILISLKELYSFFTVDHIREIYKNIERTTDLTERDKQILIGINPSLSSKN